MFCFPAGCVLGGIISILRDVLNNDRNTSIGGIERRLWFPQALVGAELTAGLLTVQECTIYARAANDFMAEMSSNTFRAIAPEDDFLLHVDNAHAG